MMTVEHHSLFLKMQKEEAEAGYKMKSFLALNRIDWKPVENKKNIMAKQMQTYVYSKTAYKNIKKAMTMALKFKYQVAGTLNV